MTSIRSAKSEKPSHRRVAHAAPDRSDLERGIFLRAAGRTVGAACVLAACAATAASAAPAVHTPPTFFAPASTPADLIGNVSWLLIAIVGVIFVVVEGALAYAVVRFRRRKRREERLPPQVYGSNPIELAWTVVPLIIVIVLFLVTTRIVFQIQDARPGPRALRVTVVAHQWWWEFRYPDLGVVTANELHVPVSDRADPRPTFLKLESADVIHSFWVPQLAGKTDVIPNRVNHTWIEPLHTGVYLGQCSEFCGAQHANMLLRVVVQRPGEFQRWVAAQREPAAVAPAGAAGRAVFLSHACINCHTIRGTRARGTFGPDLTHLMSRQTLGAGAAVNDLASLRSWVRDPASLKPGVQMPAMGLAPAQVSELVAFLRTLH